MFPAGKGSIKAAGESESRPSSLSIATSVFIPLENASFAVPGRGPAEAEKLLDGRSDAKLPSCVAAREYFELTRSAIRRSEERRVGKAGVRRFRSRRSPYQ